MAGPVSDWLAGTTVGPQPTQEDNVIPFKKNTPVQDWLEGPDHAPAIEQSLGVSPDEEAKKRKLSEQSGLPYDAVDADPAEVQKLVRKQQIDNLVKDAPLTREWLSDPLNAAVAHDDVESLTAIENIWGITKKLGEATADTVRALGAGALYVPRGINALAWGIEETLGLEDAAANAAEVDKSLADLQAMVLGGQEGLNPLVSQGIQSAGQGLALLATRNPGAAIRGAGITTAGLEATKGREEGLSPGKALLFGGMQGVAEMVTEKIPIEKLFKSLKVGDGLFKTLGQQLLIENATEQVATAWQDLNEWLFLHPEKSIGEYLEERPNAALETAVATTVGTVFQTSIAHTSVKLAQKMKGAETSKQFAEKLNKTQEALANSALTPRDPKIAIDHFAKVGPKTTYLSVDGITELANKLELSPVDLAQQLGIRPQFEKEYLRGGDIQLSAEQLGQLMLNEEWGLLSEHIRETEDSFTLREAEEFEKTGLKEEITQALNAPIEPESDEIRGWHGSPHEFDAFKIEGTARTGEGNASFGEGLYIGEAEGTGRYYKGLAARAFDFNNMPPDLEAKYGKRLDELNKELDAIHKKYPSPTESGVELTDKQFEEYTKLSTAVWNERTIIQEKILKEVRDRTGFLYEVKFKAKDTELLNWDKKLEDQPIQVLSAVENAYRDAQKEVNSDLEQGRSYDLERDIDFSKTGEQFIDEMHAMVGSNKTTELLKKYGLVGTRFLDHDSRIKNQAVTKADEVLEDYKSSIASNQLNIDGATNGIKRAKEDLETGIITQEIYSEHVQDMEARIKRSEKNIKYFEDKIKTHDRDVEKAKQAIIDNPLTNNYVVFDASRLTIIKRNGIPVGQAEIDVTAVENDIATDGLFQTSEEAGMTPTEYMFYLASLDRAHKAAVNRQNEKLLKDAQRKVSKEYKKLRKDMKESARESLANTPVYQAINSIQKDRLDRAAVAALLGDEKYLDQLPKQSKGRPIYTNKGEEGGLDPSIVAEMNGFATASDMLLAMMTALPFDQAVEQATDQMMQRQYPDLTNEKLRLDAALESLHNDATSEVLVQELNKLRELAAEKKANKPKKPAKEAKEKKPQTEAQKKAVEVRKLKLNVLKNAIKRQLENTPIKDVRVGRFVKTAKEQGKLAGKLLRKGDVEGAINAKFKQLTNFIMAQQAYKVKAETEKQNKYLNKFNSKSPPKIDQSFITAAKQLIGNYNLGPKLSDKNRIRIKEWVKKQEAAGALFQMPARLLADQKKHWQDLTIGEWREVVDAIKNIEAQGRNQRLLGRIGKEVTFAKVKLDLLNVANKVAPTARAAWMKDGKVERSRDKAAASLAFVDSALVKVENLLRYLDGGSVGVWYKAIFKPTAEAQAEQLDMVNNEVVPLVQQINKWPKANKKRLNKKTYVAPLRQEMTYSELLMLALNSGNASNLEKVIEGHNSTLPKHPMTGAPQGNIWTYQNIVDAMALLSPVEARWVQGVWDYLESLRPAVAAVYEAENGTPAQKIEAKEISIGGVKVKGGYFPMMYKYAPAHETALGALQDSAIRASVYSGMTKERTGFAAPVDLELQNLLPAIERNIHFITHYRAVRDTNRILQDNDLVNVIREKLGEEYVQALKNWAEAVATGNMIGHAPTYVDKTVEFFRRGVTAAVLGFSWTTGVSQLFGYSSSVAALGRSTKGEAFSSARGMKYMAIGAYKYLKEPGSVKQAKALSSELRHRIANTDKELGEALRKARSRYGVTGAAANAYNWWNKMALTTISGIQTYSVDIPTWIGAFNQGLDDGMSTEDAVQHADSILRTSQGTGHIKDLSAIQRKKGVMRALTMFSTYSLVLYNMEREAVLAGKKFPVDSFSRMMWAILVPALLDAALRGDAPDEEEEETWAGWFAKKTGAYAARSVPLIGTGVASWMEGYEYRASPLEAVPANIQKAAVAIEKWIEDDTEDNYKTAEALVLGIGTLLGIGGTQQAARFLDAMSADDPTLQNYLIGVKPEDE